MPPLGIEMIPWMETCPESVQWATTYIYYDDIDFFEHFLQPHTDPNQSPPRALISGLSSISPIVVVSKYFNMVASSKYLAVASCDFATNTNISYSVKGDKIL